MIESKATPLNIKSNRMCQVPTIFDQVSMKYVTIQINLLQYLICCLDRENLKKDS